MQEAAGRGGPKLRTSRSVTLNFHHRRADRGRRAAGPKSSAVWFRFGEAPGNTDEEPIESRQTADNRFQLANQALWNARAFGSTEKSGLRARNAGAVRNR